MASLFLSMPLEHFYLLHCFASLFLIVDHISKVAFLSSRNQMVDALVLGTWLYFSETPELWVFFEKMLLLGELLLLQRRIFFYLNQGASFNTSSSFPWANLQTEQDV